MELYQLPSGNELQNLHRVLFERFNNEWKGISAHELLDFVSVKTEQALTFEELSDRLSHQNKVSVKFGIDPTGPDVHLGHLVPIMLLRQFQKAGHTVCLIIGDFTAMIGDPSGRDSQRSVLTSTQVTQNKKTYLKQIAPYLNVKTAKIYHNSTWLSKLTAKQILTDLQQLSLSQILQREDFRTRMEKGVPLSVAEVLYSYFQGMDSVQLEPDIELGGRDQFLNLAHAREIMRIHNQKPQVNIVTPVLEGTSGDGRKMSKSYGNYIALSMDPEDIFGKIMSMPDSLIIPYLKSFADIKKTELPHFEEVARQHPLEMKKQLAQFMVAIATKKLAQAKKQRDLFEKKFSKKEFDVDIPTLSIASETILFEALKEEQGVTKLSNTELRRLFDDGAVKIVSPVEKTLNIKDTVANGCVVRVGKKLFLKIEVE